MTATREDLLNLPNLLSLVRIGSIPLLVVLLYLDNAADGVFWAWVAGGVFFVAGLTDLFDGLLARRLHKVTMIGQFLDPVSDKLLVSSLLVALVDLNRTASWMAIVIICRELAVTGMRAVAASQGFNVPSDRAGKLKTTIQMWALFMLILPPVVGQVHFKLIGEWSMWAAVVLTAWSGIAYFLHFKKLLQEGPEAAKN